MNIPTEEIDDDPKWNARGRISIYGITPLIEDIQRHGLINPVLVRPVVNGNFKYRLVAGFSRMKACKALRFPTIPCLVKNYSDYEADLVNLNENFIRNDLLITQEARKIQDIMLRYPDLSIDDLVERLGKSRGWIQIRRYVLDLPKEIQDECDKGYVTNVMIQFIWSRKTLEDQMKAMRAFKEAKERGVKVDVKRLEAVLSKKNPTMDRSKSRMPWEIFAMQRHIRETLGNNFGTRCLAWAAGEISDRELFGDIKNIADNEGIPYVTPATKLPNESEP